MGYYQMHPFIRRPAGFTRQEGNILMFFIFVQL